MSKEIPRKSSEMSTSIPQVSSVVIDAIKAAIVRDGREVVFQRVMGAMASENEILAKLVASYMDNIHPSQHSVVADMVFMLYGTLHNQAEVDELHRMLQPE